MIRTIKIVKIGGNVINKPEALKSFLKDFAALEGPKILIHGGGREATDLSKRLGIETKMIDGRRVTDSATIDVVTMVYAGLINKRIVAMLQSMGCDAIGLCGADAAVIRSERRSPVPVDYGFVGDISDDGVSESVIAMLLRGGLTPVFCAITADDKGNLLNTNADSVASAVACASARLMPSTLVFCFEKPGVLTDPDDDSSVIPSITKADYASLLSSGAISGGMIPKIDNAFAAIDRGVRSVVIKAATDILNPSAGTTITR